MGPTGFLIGKRTAPESVAGSWTGPTPSFHYPDVPDLWDILHGTSMLGAGNLSMQNTAPAILYCYAPLYSTVLYCYAPLYSTVLLRSTVPHYTYHTILYSATPTISSQLQSGASSELCPGTLVCHTNGLQMCRRTTPEIPVSLALGAVRQCLGAAEALGTVTFACQQL